MRPTFTLSLLLLLGACGSPNASNTQAGGPTTPVAQTPTPAPQGRFAPRDECGKLPGAAEFREKLVEAVQLRDADALAALADPAIKLDFGGGGGAAALKQQLNANGELWQSLGKLMALGCAKDAQGDLVMPWLFAQDLGTVDPTAAMLVIGEDVPILPEPRASAKPIGSMSWDLVGVARFEPEQAFQRISMPGKDDGYMPTDKLRSVLDYRLLASRSGGQWRISALVRGD